MCQAGGYYNITGSSAFALRLLLFFLDGRLAFLALIVTCICFLAPAAHAESNAEEINPESTNSWLEEVDVEWGGHFRVQAFASWPDEESIFGPVGTGTYYDANGDFRLINKLLLGTRGHFETHYEAVLSGGDTRRKSRELKGLFPFLFPEELTFVEPIEDDRRLLDLTTTVSESDSAILYHRLDRFSLTLLPEWGTLRIGRQAITWGNGFLFNPMDLFNPFAPTDILRDYKIGDDMVTAEFPLPTGANLQFLSVVRRDPEDHNVEFDESSLATKLHVARGTTEFDIMAARHFDDYVVGLGTVGYLGDAAWRADATWTFLEDDERRDGFLAFVANMDYSWVWQQRNYYGFVEFYFNGLGDEDPDDAFTDPDVIERLARGELFTLGRTFLSGSISVEAHPLLNLYLSVINNMADPSGVIQPRAIWDMTENMQLTVGASVYYGGEGTEFGGFKIPGTDLLFESPNNVFIWLTYFF